MTATRKETDTQKKEAGVITPHQPDKDTAAVAEYGHKGSSTKSETVPLSNMSSGSTSSYNDEEVVNSETMIQETLPQSLTTDSGDEPATEIQADAHSPTPPRVKSVWSGLERSVTVFTACCFDRVTFSCIHIHNL